MDAWIDPGQPRPSAIITHGHADYAWSGYGAVLATPETIAIMKVRHGEDCAGRFQALKFGQRLRIEIGGQRALVISGHCDWGELTQTISESGAA